VEEKVILVDEQDREVGTAGKTEAHQKGLLHRAFSIFIFNSKKELLIQQRALHKYHSAGLWTNTCCSHPRPGEDTLEAAKRRLEEEMGMKCELKKEYEFTYKATFENGLSENEYDHVYSGKTSLNPVPNAEEVASWKWIKPYDLKKDIEAYPEKYTAWLKIIINERFIF
jgi:isopentenyl-diphosphate delta-isomerase